jgi:hypothetical protein
MPEANPDAQKTVDDEPPPVLGTWPKAYLFVLGYTVVLISLFYFFTQYFAP